MQQPTASLLLTVLFPLTASSSLLFPKFLWEKSKFAGIISREDRNPLVMNTSHLPPDAQIQRPGVQAGSPRSLSYL